MFLIQFTARPAPRRPVGCDGVIVRAIDRGCWINLPLDTALKAKVEMPGMIGGGMSPRRLRRCEPVSEVSCARAERARAALLPAARRGPSRIRRGCTSRMATCLTRTQPTLFVIGPKPVRRSLFAQSDRGSSFSLLFGVDDLISLVVQPAPAFAKKMEVYRARVTRKACQRRWPKLRIHEFHD